MAYKNQFPLKNHLLPKYIKLKDVTFKNEAQTKYRQYRNLLSTLMKESKKILIHKLFAKQPNWLEEYMERYKESNLFKRIA